MELIIKLIGYPLAFLFVGFLYEWWLKDPLLNRLRRGRDDVVWHMLIILSVGFLAWLMYILVMKNVPVLLALESRLISLSNDPDAKSILSAISKALFGSLLVLPLHLISRLISAFLPEKTEDKADTESGSRDRVGLKISNSTGPITVNRFDNCTVVLVTEQSGRIAMGSPSKDGSFEFAQTVLAPGTSGYLVLSTADPVSGRKDIPFSGSIAFPNLKASTSISKVTGSDTDSDSQVKPIELQFQSLPGVKMEVAPLAGQPHHIAFHLSSPPGTIQKIIETKGNPRDGKEQRA